MSAPLSFKPSEWRSDDALGLFVVRLNRSGAWEALVRTPHGLELVAAECVTPMDAFAACEAYLQSTPDNDVGF